MVTEKTFSLTVGGEDREVFASFGLINELARLVGDIDKIALIAVEHDLRDKILSALLSERAKSGKVLKVVQVDDLDADYEDVLRLIAWATEHLLNFMVTASQDAAEKLTTAMQRIQVTSSHCPGGLGT